LMVAIVNGTVASSTIAPSTVKPGLVNRVAISIKLVAMFIKQHTVVGLVMWSVAVVTMGVMMVIVVGTFIIVATLFIPFIPQGGTAVARGVRSILKEVPAAMEVILNLLYKSSGIVHGAAVDDVLNRMPLAEVATGHDDCGMWCCNKNAKVERLDL